MPNVHRILVVANETCPCPGLLQSIADRAETHGAHEVRLVAPALNSRLRHYLSDIDAALVAARGRLDEALAFLNDAGVAAHGHVGDADPYIALTDALAEFDADEVLLSTHPPGQSHWLERGFVDRAAAELDVPVEHLVSAYGAAPIG